MKCIFGLKPLCSPREGFREKDSDGENSGSMNSIQLVVNISAEADNDRPRSNLLHEPITEEIPILYFDLSCFTHL